MPVHPDYRLIEIQDTHIFHVAGHPLQKMQAQCLFICAAILLLRFIAGGIKGNAVIPDTEQYMVFCNGQPDVDGIVGVLLIAIGN